MTANKLVYQEKLDAYCRGQGIKWLATHDANCIRRTLPGADLFLLVEFEEDRKVGREFFRIERELGDIMGAYMADLRALPELADYYRDEVLASATVKFASHNAAYLPQMLAEARESWAEIDAAERQAVKDKVKALPKEKLAEYCRANGIKWLATSDVDIARRTFPGVDLLLLAEFEEGYPKGWGTFKTEKELTNLFGVVGTHLLSLKGLRDNHPYREKALEVAEVLFAG